MIKAKEPSSSTLSTRKANALNTSQANLASSNTFGSANSLNLIDRRTYVRVIHGENKPLLLNSLSSCMHLVNFIKEQLGLSKEDTIDLIDFDGVLREVPNLNNKDFAIQYLHPTGKYVALRIEYDASTNEKRYTALLNEAHISNIIQKALANLNAGKVTGRSRAAGANKAKQGGGGASSGGNQSSVTSSNQSAAGSAAPNTARKANKAK